MTIWLFFEVGFELVLSVSLKTKLKRLSGNVACMGVHTRVDYFSITLPSFLPKILIINNRKHGISSTQRSFFNLWRTSQLQGNLYFAQPIPFEGDNSVISATSSIT
jgi:hypothetical protein